MAFKMQHVKRRFLVYRNGNLEVPDEVIDSSLEQEPHFINLLRHDETVDRVDLEIHQIFTWSDYLAFIPQAEKIADGFSDLLFEKR